MTTTDPLIGVPPPIEGTPAPDAASLPRLMRVRQPVPPPPPGAPAGPAPDATIGNLLSGKEYLNPAEPTSKPGPESVLDSLFVDRSVKADAWDAFHAAETPEEFQQAFDPLPLPKSIKGDLFDLKFNPAAYDAYKATRVPTTPTQLPPTPPAGVNVMPKLPGLMDIMPPGGNNDSGPLSAALPGSRKDLGGGKYQYSTIEPPPVAAPPLPPALNKNYVPPPASLTRSPLAFPGAAALLAGKILPGAAKATAGFEQMAEPGQKLAGAGTVLSGIHQAISNWGGLIPNAKPDTTPLPDPHDPVSVATYASREIAKTGQDLSRGALRGLVNLASPESVAVMMATGELGKFVPYTANLPYVRDLVKNLPYVLKTLDVVARAAVPAGVAAAGAYNQYQAGIPKTREAMGEAAVNALTMGLGAAGAIEAGIRAGETFPQAPAESGIRPLGGQEIITPEQVGGLPSVNPQEAEATAQALEARGHNLAAQAWRNTSTRTPTEINTTIGKVYLQPETSTLLPDGSRIATATLLDAQGRTVFAGPPEAARNWLDMHTGRVTGGLLRGEGGSGIIGAEPLPAHYIADSQHLAGAESEPVPVFGTNMAVRPPTMGIDGVPVYDVVNDDTGELLHRGPAESVSEFIGQNAKIPNEPEYLKAVTAWTKATEQAAIKYSLEHPGVPHQEALQAVEGMVGRKPQIEDFQKPAEAPELPEAPQPEPPPKPPKVATPTPGVTPNIQTAAMPTVPESPQTIAIQMQQLVAGQRKAVMFPKMVGEPQWGTWPDGIRRTADKFGNSYAYHPALTDPGQIHRAAENNTLPEILGHTDLGMGAPDKSALQGEPIAVTSHAPDGTEVQTAATDAEHLADTVVAAHAVTPDGGAVSVQHPEDAVAGRTGEPQPALHPIFGTPAPIEGQPAPEERMSDGTRKWASGTFDGTAYPLPAKVFGRDATVLGPAYPDGPGGADVGQLMIQYDDGTRAITTPQNVVTANGPLSPPQPHRGVSPLEQALQQGGAIGTPTPIEGVTPEPRAQMQHPLTYFTGSSGPAVENRALARGDIGLMITPLKPDYLSKADKYPVIAIDNGAFSGVTPFSAEKFLKLIDKVAADPAIARKVQFVVAPDVVRREGKKVFGDAAATLAQFPEWAKAIQERGLPVALAAQNGLEDMLDQIPWDDVDTLFIAGNDDWKTGKFPDTTEGRQQQMKWIRLLKAAAAHGAAIHVGRVNSFTRSLLSNYGMGAVSVDGTHLAHGPDQNLAHIESWLNTINNRTPEFGPHFAPAQPPDEAEGYEDNGPLKFKQHGDAFWVSSNDRFRIFDYSREGADEFRLLDNETDEAAHYPTFKEAVAAAKEINAQQPEDEGDDSQDDTNADYHPTLADVIKPIEEAPVPVATGLGAATDKQVHDLPVRATVKDGKISVVIKYKRQPVAKFSFPVSEWEATEKHPNPNYPQRQLAVAKLAATKMEDFIDKTAETNERMNSSVIDRLADSVAGAVKAAVKISKAAPSPLAGRSAVLPEKEPNVPRNAPDRLPVNGAASDQGGTAAVSPVPEGHGPESVREPAGPTDREPVHGEPEPVAGSEGEDIRRVTGSADKPLIPAGEEQAENLADKAVVPFDGIAHAANTRSRETAAPFTEDGESQVLELPSLNGWARGEYEGQPSHDVKAQMADLIANPDKMPPGVSPYSGEPGQSWNQMKDAMLRDIWTLSGQMTPESRVLLVTSGGNLQVIDAWLKAGAPADFNFDRSELVKQPYWSVTGKMFRFGPHGLEEVENNTEPGLYAIEHGETEWNQNAGAAEPNTETGVTSKSEPATEPAGTGLEGGSPADAVREGSPQALAGVSPEDVQGTGSTGPAVQSGDVGSHADGAVAGIPLEGQHPAGPGAGDSVPAVVPPAGRKGPAEPDLRSVPAPDTRSDYRLTPEEADRVENGGARTKARNNLEAIRTIKKIQAEGNRPATLEEQQALAKYVGWGDTELAQGIFQYRREWAGIRQELEDLLTPEEFAGARDSTINAHYTRRDIAAAMWDALSHMGFRTGASVIEPGMGIGNFFMMMPEYLQAGGTRRTGIEMDPLTGAMAKALYPGSNVVVKPYQDTNLPDGYFDAAIGNVPFQGKIEIYDPVFKRQPYLGKGLHNYFFSKTMLKLRPGGVMLMITSRYTMDSSSAPARAFRTWMAKEGELLGAIRLPRDTFKGNAGTSVTVDVLAIRKRVPGEESVSTEKWVDSKPFDMGSGYSVDMNEYFHNHPEMMMGKMQPGSMYQKGFPELFGTFSLDNLKEMLATLPKDVIPSWTNKAQQSGTLVESYPDAEYVKDGGYAFQNGQLVRREGGYMQPQTGLSPLRLARAKGLIDIRGAAREVLRTQEMEAPEPVILAARTRLNEVYDKFVATKIGKVKGVDKTYGPINSYSNVLALGQDPDWPLLSALEKWDKNTKTAQKTDIFSVRTKVKPKRVESTETGTEALAVSLNELGRLDWDRMQELTGRTPQELIKELEGQIYRNPITKQWETADEYLSGNVRQKLADAEFSARDNGDFNGNVEALRKVQPPDLKPGEIDAALGATWIPSQLYANYINELLKAEGTTVKLVPLTGGYAIEAPHFYSDQGVANRIEHGTPYFSGMDLFEMAMNGISPVARDEITDFEGRSRTVKNPAGTVEAVEKQRRIMNEFSTWFWQDADRATRMARKYNLERNNLKLREYNGSHLTFPGLNRTWLRNQDLDKHQKNAIWRMIQSGNTLLAHAVGAGKTLEIVVGSMEMKRLGLIRKPMIVVPNYLVGQWRDAFLQAYPNAQILVPTKNSFEKGKRARLMSQVATGNFDAIIVGHKSFELLPVKDATFQNFMDAQIDEVTAAIDAMKEGVPDSESRKDPTTKQLVRRKKQLEERLKKRTNRDTKDVTVTFEELGVDGLFVDEAHAYKNLGYMTMMDRIAGLPNTDANRSVDMLLKSQYINQLHGNNRGLVFATGTPVSNSLAEIWTMMRYLMPQYLKDEGFDQFDAWAKTFGTKVTDMEVAPEGNRMISRTRFADFINAPELMNMFRIVADVRTKEQLNLPTPAILGGGEQDVVVPASRGLKNYISLLGERADAVRSGSVEPEDDNMLKISSDGRKASLDLRLVDPSAKEDRNTKAHAAIRSIISLYKEFDEHKATQLVFLDLSTPKAEGKKKKSAVANTDAPPAEPEAAKPEVANVDEAGEEPEEELDLYGEKEAEVPEDTDTEEEKKERFTVYSQIRQHLIAGGIPAEEIAFIHDANTDARRLKLFDQMNDGTIRVMLGSTEKMGAGMNVQKRLIALHHLDAPWRPSDWEQRNGRIDRQGNMLWDEHQIPIRIFRYMTEGSFDAFMWQTIVAKARPITRFMNGDPTVRRVQEPVASVMSAEQAMAVSSGNPEVREKIILDQDIGKLEILRSGWMNEQANIAQTLATVPASIRSSQGLIKALQDDIATRDGDPSLKVAGKQYETTDIRKDGATALVAMLKQMGPVSEPTPLDAAYHGFPLTATPDTEDMSFAGPKRLPGTYPVLYAREGPKEGPLFYYEVGNPRVGSEGMGGRGSYMRAELELRPLSKKEAEAVHKEWDKGIASSFEYLRRPVYTNPNLRLVAASHNYPAVVNYESPSGTIASADHAIRGFEEDLTNSQANLRRLQKQKTELESKQGQPFRDEEKLMKMIHRQRELAEKLGENKDDVQALGAMEDEDNPLAPLLKDPTSAMLPEWFPSRKIYVAGAHGGQKTSEKVHVINKYLAVQPEKVGRSQRYRVIHMPTGAALANFAVPAEAVAFARQAADARDWNYTVAPDGIRTWVRDFEDEQLQVPAETPKESVARLVKPPEVEGEEKRSGPIARYEPLKGKLPVPEYTKGEKGWMQTEVDGKNFAINGNYSSSYIIQAEKTPLARSTPIPAENVRSFLHPKEAESPVKAVAFSTATVKDTDKAAGKDTRIIWFSNGKAIDGRYYDDVRKLFPGATFAATAAQPGRILINDKTGNRVGVTVMMRAPQMPDALKPLLLPPGTPSAPPLRRPPPYDDVLARPRTDLIYSNEGRTYRERKQLADASFERLLSGQGHVYVNRSGMALIETAMQKLDHEEESYHGLTVGSHTANDLEHVLMGYAKAAEDAEEKAAIERVLAALAQARSAHGVVTFVEADPDTRISEIQKTRREEAFHRQQLIATFGKPAVDVAALKNNSLLKRGYDAVRVAAVKRGRQRMSDQEVFHEVGAALATGEGESLGLSPTESIIALRMYMSHIEQRHGEQAQDLLHYILPGIRKAMGGKYASAEGQIRQDRRYGARTDRPASSDEGPLGRVSQTSAAGRSQGTRPPYVPGRTDHGAKAQTPPINTTPLFGAPPPML